MDEWKSICKKLWKIKLEIKIQIFFWKIMHGGLPIGERIKYLGGEASCRRCGNIEDIEHIFWSGCLAKQFWVNNMTANKAIDIFNQSKGQAIIPILAWSFWKIRNLIVFDGFVGNDKEAMLVVCRFAKDIIQHQSAAMRDYGKIILKGEMRGIFVDLFLE